MKDKLDEKEINTVLNDARDKFEDTNLRGPYGHNIATLILRGVAEKIGKKYANKLIDEFHLENLGIRKVEE